MQVKFDPITGISFVPSTSGGGGSSALPVNSIQLGDGSGGFLGYSNFLFDGNLATLENDALLTTPIVNKGWLILNNTPATVLAQTQISPPLTFLGHGWNSSGLAADNVTAIQMYVYPTPATSAQANAVLYIDELIGTTLAGATRNNVVKIGGSAYAMDLTGGIRISNQLLVLGPGTFNSIVNFNNPITNFSTSTFNGDITANTASFNGVVSINNVLDDNNNGIRYDSAYNNIVPAFSVGRNDTTHNASVEGGNVGSISIVTPSLNSASLIQEPSSGTISSASATQTVPSLGQPQSVLVQQSNDPSGHYVATGNSYTARMWAFDGTAWCVIPSTTSSFTDDLSLQNYDLLYTWVPPGFGTATDYMIGLVINGGSEVYLDLHTSSTGYSDSTGSYPDSFPSPLYSDYVANGTTRNYTAYSFAIDPLGNPYYSTGTPYSMTDDNSGTPYRVLHNVNSSLGQVRVIGAPDGSSANDHFDQGSFDENGAIWVTGNTVTPNHFGYLANGATLTNTYTLYNQGATPLGGMVYSAASGTQGVTDPNDSNYYYVTFSVSSLLTNYKIARTGDLTGYQVENYPSPYDFSYFAWSDTSVVTPTSYSLPAGWFGTTNAGSPAIVLKNASSQAVDSASYLNSSGVEISGLGPNYEIKPPHLADSAAVNDSIYFSTTSSKLVYKDSGSSVHALY